MHPIIVSFGNLTISSFGLFLVLGVIFASFAIWRVVRVYDFDEEKTIDLILWVGAWSLVFSRLYFIAQNPTQFGDFFKIILINKYAGLSFWGALVGGFITLRIYTARYKVNFWQMADYAMIGGILVIAFGTLGCLLSSCNVGIPTNSFLGVSQAGFIGKRFPVQIFEFLFFIGVFCYLWRKILRFHFNGQIFALGLIMLAIIKLGTEPFHMSTQKLFLNIPDGYFWSILILGYGLLIYYRQAKRSFRGDVEYLGRVFMNGNVRNKIFSRIIKRWSGFIIDTRISLAKWTRILVKYLNVKSNPTKF